MLAQEHISIIMWGLPNYAHIGNSWNWGEKRKHWFKYQNGLKCVWSAIFDYWNCGNDIICFWLWNKIQENAMDILNVLYLTLVIENLDN
jgi:hypothetical protein